MSLSPVPLTRIITTKGEVLTDVWTQFFNSVQQWLGPQGQKGATSARPTTNLYVGLSYFDTTLGYPVFVKQVSPSVVWVNASGSTV